MAVNLNADIPYSPPPLLTEQESAESKQTQREYLKVLSTMRASWSKYFLESTSEQKPSAEPKLEKAPSLFNVLTRTIDLMEDRIIALTINQHKPDVLVNISRDVSGILEFYKAKELIDEGRRACKEALDEYEHR